MGAEWSLAYSADPLYERIYRTLRDGIARNLLSAGDRLTETQIARHFAVSREPARQSLRLLEQDGLVRSSANKRGFVVGDGDGLQHADLSALSDLGTDGELGRARKWTTVYDRIKADLLSGSSQGQYRIIPSRLADAHGITRTVLADVQVRLIADGLLRLEGQDWLLNRLDEKGIRDQYEVRKLLEPHALTLGFKKIDRALAARCLDDLKEANGNRDMVTAGQLEGLERDLHVRMLAPCDNVHLMEILRQSRLVHVFNSYYFEKYRPRHTFMMEHIDVFEAILAGRLRHAREALIDHMNTSIEDTIRRLSAFAEAQSTHDSPYLKPISATPAL